MFWVLGVISLVIGVIVGVVDEKFLFESWVWFLLGLALFHAEPGPAWAPWNRNRPPQ